MVFENHCYQNDYHIKVRVKSRISDSRCPARFIRLFVHVFVEDVVIVSNLVHLLVVPVDYFVCTSFVVSGIVLSIAFSIP